MLAEEDISFIKSHLASWLAEQSLGKPPVVYEIELRERMVRVEEALKNQGDELKLQRELIRDLMIQMDKRFEQVDNRFEQMREESNKRFEQVDKRFEQMREESNKRFEQVDKRFEQVDKRFEQIDNRFEQVDKRFEQVDKRFEQMRQESEMHFTAMREDTNKRFDQVHQEILQIHRDMRQLSLWGIGIFISIVGLAVAIFRLI